MSCSPGGLQAKGPEARTRAGGAPGRELRLCSRGNEARRALLSPAVPNRTLLYPKQTRGSEVRLWESSSASSSLTCVHTSVVGWCTSRAAAPGTDCGPSVLAAELAHPQHPRKERLALPNGPSHPALPPRWPAGGLPPTLPMGGHTTCALVRARAPLDWGEPSREVVLEQHVAALSSVGRRQVAPFQPLRTLLLREPATPGASPRAVLLLGTHPP